MENTRMDFPDSLVEQYTSLLFRLYSYAIFVDALCFMFRYFIQPDKKNKQTPPVGKQNGKHSFSLRSADALHREISFSVGRTCFH